MAASASLPGYRRAGAVRGARTPLPPAPLLHHVLSGGPGERIAASLLGHLREQAPSRLLALLAPCLARKDVMQEGPRTSDSIRRLPLNRGGRAQAAARVSQRERHFRVPSMLMGRKPLL